MLALSLVFYFFFVSLVSSVRASVRLDKGIIGNPVEDFFCCFVLYPVVSVQLTETMFGSGTVQLMPRLNPDLICPGEEEETKSLTKSLTV